MAVRKLVVCCDGTWNTPRTGTNIVRTYNFLRERLGAPPEVSQKHGMTTCTGRAQDGSDILLYYDEGVGTNWFTRLAGGGVGAACPTTSSRPITSWPTTTSRAARSTSSASPAAPTRPARSAAS